jgi:uroporphyrinogen decarboxylase|tara:strand:- start:3285 stop:4310 length:1026 start_codon:yes stop_codon:yes gene_type:complete
MDSILMKTLNGEKTSRPPVWFMRQAGRILPNYMKLKETYSFHELMNDKNLASQVTLMPIKDLNVDAAILFSDILVIPHALGLDVEFKKTGPIFNNPLNYNSKATNLEFDPNKLDYIYDNIDQVIKDKNPDTPLIGFCGGPLTVFLFMFKSEGSKDHMKKAIKFLYEKRKESTEILELITKSSIEYVKGQCNSGINVFQLFETYCGSIPCELYADLILPYSKRILNAAKEEDCPTIFFPKDFGHGMNLINKDICDFISVDWHTSINYARNIIDKKVGIQGNMDPRIFYQDYEQIEAYLNSLTNFGSQNFDWIFNLGHGFLPDINHEKVKFAIDWIKDKNWNR